MNLKSSGERSGMMEEPLMKLMGQQTTKISDEYYKTQSIKQLISDIKLLTNE